MSEEKMQLSRSEMEKAMAEGQSQELGVSDDDLAANLGLITSLTEGMLPQVEEGGEEGSGEEEEMAEEDPLKEIQEDTSGTPDKDKEQDDEIAMIKSQLEQLLAEENTEEINEQEGENTGTTEPAE